MKQFKLISKLFLCLILISNFTFAQEEEPTMFLLQTDFVNFNKMAEYEDLAKKFVDSCNVHDFRGTSWSAASTEDGRYMYIIPMENMAMLDKNIMSDLSDKMGKEKLGEMFDKLDECYDKQRFEIIHYIPELSFNPEGYTRDGMNAREWHFLYYVPKNRKSMNEMMGNIKSMFAEKGVKNGYNVYHSGFGSDASFYVVSVAGKDRFHLAEIGKENDEVLGEDADGEFFKLIQLASKYDQVNGGMRPDLGYIPTKSE